jgi:predicted nucleotidyltransferase
MLTHENIAGAVRKAANNFPLTKAAYFGSYAEGSATEESDLDLLIEYKKGPISILTTIALKHFLEEELAKPVDVVEAPLPPGAIIEIGKTVGVL